MAKWLVARARVGAEGERAGAGWEGTCTRACACAYVCTCMHTHMQELAGIEDERERPHAIRNRRCPHTPFKAHHFGAGHVRRLRRRVVHCFLTSLITSLTKLRIGVDCVGAWYRNATTAAIATNQSGNLGIQVSQPVSHVSQVSQVCQVGQSVKSVSQSVSARSKRAP